MTLHLAKGLEYDVAFLIGLEEGLLPHVRSLDSQADLEEERRLCYVGITRAKKQLYITRAMSRQTFGRGGWYSGEPSRFIYDIPREVIESIGGDYLDF
jgi:DNA helicase-2/ATP-dependent DNA helicase PcrA